VEYLIGVLLTLLALAPVVAPFVAARGDGLPTPAGDELRDLLAEKRTVYAAIKELEFDYRAGKLAREDYEQARRAYERRAVTLLEQIDRVRGRGGHVDRTAPREGR